MLDPLIVQSIAIAFALILTLAALHKLKDRAEFARVVLDYRLVPERAVPFVAWFLPIAELIAGIAWLVSDEPAPAALLTGTLVLVYTLAVLINLLRGRVHIGCGCSFPGSTEDDQPLSYGIVGRNLALIAMALAMALPISDRELTAFDSLAIAALLLTVALLYAAANQLMSNSAAIGSWRHRRD